MIHGRTTVSSAAGSTATVAFSAASAPALADTNWYAVASAGCEVTAQTATGFTITRLVTVSGSSGVTWRVEDAKLA